MEPLLKGLAIVKESIESLRWWSFAVLVASAYLKYFPATYQPFVTEAYLRAEDRSNLLGLLLLGSTTIFAVGWLAAGVGNLLGRIRLERDRNTERRRKIEEIRTERRKRRAEDRLRRMRGRLAIRSLSVNQLRMVRAALANPDGILKVSNDAQLDTATLLVTKSVFDRIRPWYNERGGVIGEVFVVKDWVRSLQSERD